MKFLKRPFVYAAIFAAALMACNVYTLMDTFVLSHAYAAASDSTSSGSQSESSGGTDGGASDSSSAKVSSENTDSAENTGGTASNSSGTDGTDSSDSSSDTDSGSDTGAVTVTDNSYEDDNISITVTEYTAYDTSYYVADVQVSSAEYLKTALAQNTFGTNITETTSSQASGKNAILAVNGDYYGADRSGYVIKNGTVYRSTVRDDTEYDDLVIYADGSFGIINESDISAEELVAQGVTQLFAFGPTLVQDGEVAVSENTEVGKAMASNPRTAIGIIDDLHYVFVVADGRSSESEGLSLYELAQIMQEYGCVTAYNLDGGGSSTMYFNGQVVNNPTTNGKSFSEREVSDIVYIGYE